MPICGEEIIKSSINYTGMIQTLIMDRLTEYGYEEKNPKNGDFIHRSGLLYNSYYQTNHGIKAIESSARN